MNNTGVPLIQIRETVFSYTFFSRTLPAAVLGLLLVFAAGTGTEAAAQELAVTVRLDQSRVQGTSQRHLNDLPKQIETYLNGRRWAESRLEAGGPIKVDFLITLLGNSEPYRYDAAVVIRSLRPVRQAPSGAALGKETTVFLFNDEQWSFDYKPNHRLRYDPLRFDEITSLLDFYAHIILGYHMDTVTELGGTPHFSEAANIASLAQTASSSGWSRSGDTRRSRVQLSDNLQSARFNDFRRAMYRYHALGLDRLAQHPERARGEIMAALETIRSVRERTTSNLLLDTFFSARYRELVALFIDAPPETRRKAYGLLSEVDQSHLSEYNALQ